METCDKYSEYDDKGNLSSTWLDGSYSGNYSYNQILVMNISEKKPFETLLLVFHVFFTILPVLFFVAFATVTTRKILWRDASANSDSIRRFLLEFLIIVIPIILNVTVANAWVEAVCAVLLLVFLVLIRQKNCFELARARNNFHLGKQPFCLTFDRSVINIITAVCILAIDFKTFPKEFRKSRRFGAGIMDTGIGLFVFAMGTVSRPARRMQDLKKLLLAVAPVLFLGFARTIVIHAIDYHQDENEYGRHLNAFFTLGLTKFVGTLISAFVNNEIQLIPIGIGLLAVHEHVLLLGLSDFVLNKEQARDNFFTANREGICSLPGFVAIYLISMYIGRLFSADQAAISYSEYMQKLKLVTKLSVGAWLTLFACIGSVGISRRLCNFGYATWIMSLALTMSAFFMFFFDLVVNISWPQTEVAEIVTETAHSPNKVDTPSHTLPSIVEAVNRNGLTFFLIANILTGGVNIFLAPENRTASECILILTCYMLLSVSVVYFLYRLRVKIA